MVTDRYVPQPLPEWSEVIAKLVEGLRPFAEAANNFDSYKITNPEEWFANSGQRSADGVKGAITVADLRRARDLVNKFDVAKMSTK